MGQNPVYIGPQSDVLGNNRLLHGGGWFKQHSHKSRSGVRYYTLVELHLHSNVTGSSRIISTTSKKQYIVWLLITVLDIF